MSRILIAPLFFLCIFLPLDSTLLARQTMSSEERIRQIQEEERTLRQKLEEKKEAPEIEEKIPQRVTPLPTSIEKILIRKINVTGVTPLLQKEIKDIILPFENKELTLTEMQKATDLITDAYRKNGYITSRAYLPPQKIKENILEIMVVEGLMGNLEIKGNRYFKTTLIKKKIKLNKGEPFNYNKLRNSLSKINQHPDINMRAVLAPGKEVGTTDVVLEVKDWLPVHMDLAWDNFGSRYIEKDRYQATLSHNNFLGLNDILTLQYQTAQADAYRLTSLRYLLPLTDSTEIGFFAARTKLDLGKELKESMARGKSRLYGFYATLNLINQENLNLNLNVGFDYKDIFNFQLGQENSRDRIRVVKTGFDLDISDRLGRTVFNNEIDFGIPNIMGALREQDLHSSRTGSGGKFIKETLNLLRLQEMPFHTTLLWKNQVQLSPYILTATEQFQIGGISNNRGYPPAEVVGDRGYASTWEWSFPPYFLSKNIKVPFSRAKLYDALRVAMFYDWATARLRRPSATEEKNKTLRSVGCGIRFNLPEDFSVRLDFGWPLDNTPTDSDHLHTWTQVSKSF